MIVKSYIHPLIEIRGSTISGKGMFAKDIILKGTIVIRWGGTFVHKDKLPKDRKRYIIIQVDEDLWSIEPKSQPEDESYFINHSCNPNVWMVDGITFVTSRDIKKGEELTTDYSLFEKEEYIAKWKCSCGAKECRKEITGKDYLIPALQKKYGEHFSPVIKKKIGNDEKIIVVNDKDQVIGFKDRRKLEVEDRYRVSALWVMNPKGEILLAKRALTKSHSPGKWGPAVAGTNAKDETYESNILKEAKEEIGLEKVKLKKGPKVEISLEHSYFAQWFIATSDKNAADFKIQKEEVAEVKWFKKEEILKRWKETPSEFVPTMGGIIELFLK